MKADRWCDISFWTHHSQAACGNLCVAGQTLPVLFLVLLWCLEVGVTVASEGELVAPQAQALALPPLATPVASKAVWCLS